LRDRLTWVATMTTLTLVQVIVSTVLYNYCARVDMRDGYMC